MLHVDEHPVQPGAGADLGDERADPEHDPDAREGAGRRGEARRGRSGSAEAACDGSHRSVVAQDGCRRAHPHGPRERPGQDDLARLEARAVLVELVREPRDTRRGVVEHAGGDAGLFDLVVARRAAPGTQRRSISSGRIGMPPSTIPPYAALSAIVSTIVRPSSSMCELRISSAGMTYSVARSTSKRVQSGPFERASSARRRARPRCGRSRSGRRGCSAPVGQTVSSNITP